MANRKLQYFTFSISERDKEWFRNLPIGSVITKITLPPDPLHALRIPENISPINQICKQKLKEAGEFISEDYLYSLQLMIWALESHSVEIQPWMQEYMLYQISVMYDWKPASAMTFLIQSPDSPEDVLINENDLDGSPEEVAVCLLECLHLQIKARIPSYG